MNPLSMFELPRLKLAITYLIIIMGMSIIFSYAIYNISNRELMGQRALQVPKNIPVELADEFEALRELRLEKAQDNLRQRLILFNLVSLIFGAVLSYALAVRALQPIEEAMEAQNRFTSDASHEIRTPLTVMKSEIEVALRDKNLDLNDAKSTLASNLEEVLKLESLTSGLLQLARHENIAITKEQIPAPKLFNQALAQIKPAIKKKDITINKKDVADITVFAEPQTLEQVIIILLDNAVKYSPEKSEIWLSANNTRNSTALTIKDHGPGIDPADLPHIFERFYRSDKSRTKIQKTDGYGLGLPIARQIIESHGGNISITSKPNKETIASIYLPKK